MIVPSILNKWLISDLTELVLKYCWPAPRYCDDLDFHIYGNYEELLLYIKKIDLSHLKERNMDLAYIYSHRDLQWADKTKYKKIIKLFQAQHNMYNINIYEGAWTATKN